MLGTKDQQSLSVIITNLEMILSKLSSAAIDKCLQFRLRAVDEH